MIPKSELQLGLVLATLNGRLGDAGVAGAAMQHCQSVYAANQ